MEKEKTPPTILGVEPTIVDNGFIKEYIYAVELSELQRMYLRAGKKFHDLILVDFEYISQPSQNKYLYKLTFVEGTEHAQKLEPLGIAPKIKKIKLWNEAVTQNPIGTNDIRLDPNGRARHAKICDEVSFVKKETLDEMIKLSYAQFIDGLPTYQRKEDKKEMQKRIIPTYIGYKGREITLVWADGSKTKAIAKEDERLDFAYGFLIAYYKHINKHLHSKALQKRLQERLYQATEEFQYGYLLSVFYENCGLSDKKILDFMTTYIYAVSPFELNEDELNITYTVDKKFLNQVKPKYMKIPF